MRLQFLSDLHVEFFKTRLGVRLMCKSLLTDADLLMVCGDLGCHGTDAELLEEALDVFCNYYPRVVWVPGNHEYYMSSFKHFEKLAKELAGRYPNLIPGNFYSEELYPEGPSLHTCTGWFVEKPDLSYKYWHRMMDSRLIGLDKIPRLIRHVDGLFGGYDEPDWIDSAPISEFFRRGEESALWLEEKIKPRDIVCTHHAPTYMSVSNYYKTDKTNYFYVNELFQGLIYQDPGLWVHGHMHGSNDYMAGETRIISNPRGYDNGKDLNPHFQPHLVVDV